MSATFRPEDQKPSDENSADVCPRPPAQPTFSTIPHSPPIYLTSVWECESGAQADAILGGTEPGYVYQRDGHPNGDQLAQQCNRLQGAECGIITGTGMGAISAAVLALLKAGDQIVVGSRVYGKTLVLLNQEVARLGIEVVVVDTCDLAATKAAVTSRTRLLLAETIANPLLQVAEIGALAAIAHSVGAKLLVDNTFASPLICQPLKLGADLVMESLTKTMNGHSDVVLGYLGGTEASFGRVKGVVSAWGLAASPFDSWLALRGLATAHLRIERASANAFSAAQFLSLQPQLLQVFYPGLASHPDHPLAKKQFSGQFGTMVAFELRGGRVAADRFLTAAKRIPFCPSLGELSTTLSHPETTSHRGLTPAGRSALGISGGTIRLSVGTESAPFIQEILAEGLQGVG